MKRIALILIYNLCVSFICAQTNYYLEDKTFNEDGYTYQADVIGIMVQLYNQDNQWVGRSPKYKVDGSPFFQPEYGYIESYDKEYKDYILNKERIGIDNFINLKVLTKRC